MAERAVRFEFVPGIDAPYTSISFAYEPGDGRSVVVTMRGPRPIRLKFHGAIALRFEDECPGFDPLPHPLPMLRQDVTFPVLRIEGSKWLAQWSPNHQKLAHFALVSSDDLVQIIAQPEIEIMKAGANVA